MEEKFVKLYDDAQKTGKLASLIKEGAQNVVDFCGTLYSEVKAETKRAAQALQTTSTTPAFATTKAKSADAQEALRGVHRVQANKP